MFPAVFRAYSSSRARSRNANYQVSERSDYSHSIITRTGGLEVDIKQYCTQLFPEYARRTFSSQKKKKNESILRWYWLS